ncbi:hypothetical protein ACQEVX_21575 [Streptomyces syringium]|uniref:hypothetical protein n=1 Tax=Streptomyces syringium TaxID=76729 RepID=UPI003D944A5D
MSFGDQNNPYGQQPPQGQPGYGYPQQAPQGVPAQPGQPYAPFPQDQGGGYNGAPYGQPFAMPGLTKAARVLLYVIAGVHVVLAGLFATAIAAIDDAVEKEGTGGTVRTANGEEVDVDTVIDAGKGVIAFFVLLAAVFAIIGIILAARYGKGRNGVRVGSIVYSSFGIISGLITSVMYGLGLVTLVASILVIVFAAKRVSSEWFQRPRY